MKQINKLIAFVLLAISMIACSKDKKEEQANTYLNEARLLYQTKEYKQANDVLDSLLLKFPMAYDAKSWAGVLQDSIQRDVSRLKIDSLDQDITSLKIEILHLKKGADTDQKLAILQTKIDSLNLLKQPYRTLINEVGYREGKRAACRQCVTTMQN